MTMQAELGSWESGAQGFGSASAAVGLWGSMPESTAAPAPAQALSCKPVATWREQN